MTDDQRQRLAGVVTAIEEQRQEIAQLQGQISAARRDITRQRKSAKRLGLNPKAIMRLIEQRARTEADDVAEAALLEVVSQYSLELDKPAEGNVTPIEAAAKSAPKPPAKPRAPIAKGVAGGAGAVRGRRVRKQPVAEAAAAGAA